MFSQEDRDRFFMDVALKEARAAMESEEVPVGAVFVKGDRILARAGNQVVRLHDPTAHAEMIALTAACAALEAARLTDVEVFVTKEPCVMCAGALVHARVGRLVVGTPDIKAGACGTVLDLTNHPRLNHSIPTVFGVMEEECRALLQAFFRARR